MPNIQGPIEPANGISFLGSTLFPPSEVGYEQSEFFLSGTATAYASAKKLTRDGRWHVTPQTTAPYTTRIVVYRPIDPNRFNGTVAVEWLNVTGGIDAPAAWLNSHVQMIRAGMAYVGVDAQVAGINGIPGSIAAKAGAGGLKESNPSRYGSLDHPGDSFSYSLYEQAGQAVRSEATRLLGGLEPRTVLAIGESQSAFRLTTYINAIEPLSTGMYDGYFVYSRGGSGADLSQAPQAVVATPTPTYLRTDLRVPVFLFETESDLLSLGYLAARQPPTRYIREWELAGTAHDDSYGLLSARTDTGDGAADTQAFASMRQPSTSVIPGVECPAPINAGSHTYELRAALGAFERWATTGKAPRQSPRLQLDPKNPDAFATDSHGNAAGGVRIPQVAAPVATLSGVGQPGTAAPTRPGHSKAPVTGSTLCGVFGTTRPFSADKIAQLYPDHAAFVTKWQAATSAAVRAGYLLPADAQVLNNVAAASSVGG